MPTPLAQLPKIRSLRELLQTEGQSGIDRYLREPVMIRNKSKKPFGSPGEYRDPNTGRREFSSPCAVSGNENYWLAPKGEKGSERLVPMEVVYTFLGNPVDDDPNGTIRGVEHTRLRLRYGAVDHMSTEDISLHRLYDGEGLGDYYPLPDLRGEIPELEIVDPTSGEVIDAAWPLYDKIWNEPTVDAVAAATQIAQAGEDRVKKLEAMVSQLLIEAEKQGVVLLDNEAPKGD